ncbi:hypothetical protein D3C75_1038480 [compost metagenome]
MGATRTGTVAVQRTRPLFQDAVHIIGIAHATAHPEPPCVISAGHRVTLPGPLPFYATDGVSFIRRAGKNAPPTTGFIQVIQKISRSHNPS